MISQDDDWVQWTREQAAALRDRRFDTLDIEGLAEEIESLGREDRREVERRLATLVAHLVRQRTQPHLAGRAWEVLIGHQRMEIAMLIRESPSLRAELPALFADARESANLLMQLDVGVEGLDFGGVVITLTDALPEEGVGADHVAPQS